MPSQVHRHRRSRLGRLLGLLAGRPVSPRRLAASAAIAIGLALLLYTGYQLWDPASARVRHQLTEQLQRHWRDDAVRPGHLQPIRLVTGEPFALLRIPRFGAHWQFPIVQGTSLAQLAVAPGHVPGTQLPGQRGNFAVAAHDITAGNPFLHLKSLRWGDKVVVTTVNATYTYRVTSEAVVAYTDVGVLDPVPEHPGQSPTRNVITLITCTPVTLAFTPWRVIVTGILVSSVLK